MQLLLRYYQSYGSMVRSNDEVITESRDDSQPSPSTTSHTNHGMDVREHQDVGSEYYISISSEDRAQTSPASSVASTEPSSCSEDAPPNHSSQGATQPTNLNLHKRNSTRADVRLSMVSNFSAAYNTVNISLALVLMQSTHPPEDSSSITSCSSSLLAGMILGQLGGGLLGDWLGRHMAMAVVMSLQVGAAFMSAWSGIIMLDRNIYTVLSCWRFLLGVGCGGVYPLAATITAESASETQNKGKSVALTFSMQGVGYLAVSLVAYFLVSMLGEDSDIAWRLLLGLGSLPGLVLTGVRLYRRNKDPGSISSQPHLLRQATNEVIGSASNHGDIEVALSYDHIIGAHDSDELTSFNKQKKMAQVRLKPTSLFQQILNEPNLCHNLIGTAGCWLLFDLLFYGNALFQPTVLSAAFGETETTIAVVRDSVLISLMSLPGYFVSVAMVERQSPKRIQLQGFLCMSVLYTIIGVKFGSLNRFSLLGIYGMTFFFSNYGPNSTTFMLPSMTFSRPCRSTLNGVCAASGKLGALIGASIFLPLASWVGNAEVMILCAIISAISAILTFFFTDDGIEARLKDGVEVARISSVAYLVSLQEEGVDAEEKRKLPKTVSMPTFLDSE